VLATVVSRCQRYDLRRIGLGELRAHLAARSTPEAGCALGRGRWRWWRVKRRGARARRAVPPGAGADGRGQRGRRRRGGARCWAQARPAAGRWRWPTPVLAGDPRACVRHLAELHAHGYDAQRFCRDLLEHFRHLAVLAATGDRALVAELPEADGGRRSPRRPGAARPTTLQRFFRLSSRPMKRSRCPHAASTRSCPRDVRWCGSRPCRRSSGLDDILHRLEAFGAGNPPPPAAGAAAESVPAGRARRCPAAACGTGSWRACRRRSWSRPNMMLVSITHRCRPGRRRSARRRRKMPHRVAAPSQSCERSSVSGPGRGGERRRPACSLGSGARLSSRTLAPQATSLAMARKPLEVSVRDGSRRALRCDSMRTLHRRLRAASRSRASCRARPASPPARAPGTRSHRPPPGTASRGRGTLSRAAPPLGRRGFRHQRPPGGGGCRPAGGSGGQVSSRSHAASRGPTFGSTLRGHRERFIGLEEEAEEALQVVGRAARPARERGPPRLRQLGH